MRLRSHILRERQIAVFALMVSALDDEWHSPEEVVALFAEVCHAYCFPALYVAAAMNHKGMVKHLLDAGHSNEGVGVSCKWTALHVTAEWNAADVASQLLQNGARVHAVGNRAPNNVTRSDIDPYFTALHVAAEWDSVAVARVLLRWGSRAEGIAKKQERQDQEQSRLMGRRLTPSNSTPLHVACRCGSVGVAALLLEHGAEIEALTSMGYTPLQLGLWYGRNGIVSLLLDAGADLGHGEPLGWTPLMVAAACNNLAAAQMLLDRGSGRTNGHGMRTLLGNISATALYEAVYSGHEEMARLLLEHGASMCDIDVQGRIKAIHRAVSKGVGLIRLLHEHGADLSQRNTEGKTPLHTASHFGKESVVRYLLSEGVEVDALDHKRMTPLGIAFGAGVERPKAHVCSLLLDAGADLGSVTDEVLWKACVYDSQIVCLVQRHVEMQLLRSNRLARLVQYRLLRFVDVVLRALLGV